MMGKRQTETDEQGAKHKKTMWEYVSKQWQTETEEQAAKRKNIKQDYTSRKRLTETDKQAAKHKKTMQECVSKQRQTETEEQTDGRKKTNWDNMRRKQEEMRHRFLNDSRDCNGEDMTNVIDRATKKSKTIFNKGHRIQQTPISIGQLCVSYVIVSSLAQKPFTNLPRKTLGHIVEDLVSKIMKSTTKPH